MYDYYHTERFFFTFIPTVLLRIYEALSYLLRIAFVEFKVFHETKKRFLFPRKSTTAMVKKWRAKSPCSDESVAP